MFEDIEKMVHAVNMVQEAMDDSSDGLWVGNISNETHRDLIVSNLADREGEYLRLTDLGEGFLEMHTKAQEVDSYRAKLAE